MPGISQNSTDPFPSSRTFWLRWESVAAHNKSIVAASKIPGRSHPNNARFQSQKFLLEIRRYWVWSPILSTESGWRRSPRTKSDFKLALRLFLFFSELLLMRKVKSAFKKGCNYAFQTSFQERVKELKSTPWEEGKGSPLLFPLFQFLLLCLLGLTT